MLAVDPALCNVAASNGKTPLMSAASSKQAKFIMFCLMLGPPPNAHLHVTNAGCQAFSPPDIPFSDSTPHPAETKPGEQAFELEQGQDKESARHGSQGMVVVDVLAQCHLGRTALHYAASANDAASSVALLSIRPMMPQRHYQSPSQTETFECVLIRHFYLQSCRQQNQLLVSPEQALMIHLFHLPYGLHIMLVKNCTCCPFLDYSRDCMPEAQQWIAQGAVLVYP